MEGLRDILESLALGRDLSGEQTTLVFDALMGGQLTPSQAGALLMGLRAKGETPIELAAAVSGALRHAKLLEGLAGPCIDTCGTGGDGTCSFNCSTAVALFLADMGYQVVKHGNRAVSSSCGSADAVEAVGLPLPKEPGEAAAELARRNFVFLFAPFYHPAFANVAPTRRELGIRTMFNFMGPLLNPARPTHQLLGVGVAGALDLMAQALALTGVDEALVVHGFGGFDELTTFGPAQVRRVRRGRAEPLVIDPQVLGLPRHRPEDVRVDGKEQAIAVLKDVLSGRGNPAMRDMTALNLAACLSLLTDSPLGDCLPRAREKVSAGLSGEVLHA
ncbi:MAG TPA: anthranilate phosphoribosyltransferase [Desulfovibrio sp.]|uniref:anthranilate phosphoribosyltransferase n=1 Tax=Desulfovibrio sp. TaxID=885 RepID=UPI002CAAFC16|nr:anthranilate phosphoribosyltransferase [Desulfovibrio sp.]HMM38760.1 anthranilate phosphoribosyltransferase [Desulfovibrio sp.]